MVTVGDKPNEERRKRQRRDLERNGLNRSQIDFCMSEAEHIRLLAPAGSGKTLSLLWRCKVLQEREQKKGKGFLIFTFTRTARDELKNRLSEDPAFSAIRDKVRITTLNEWGNQYLHSLKPGLKVVANDRDKFNLMNHDLREFFESSSHNIKEFYRTKRKGKRYVGMVNIFDTMRNCGFRHDVPKNDLLETFRRQVAWLERNGLGTYFNKSIKEELEKVQVVDRADESLESFRPFLEVWKKSCEHLWRSAKITFDDQKYISLVELEAKYKDKRFPDPNRYQHVLVDEFQDISPLDMSLIKCLVKIYESSLTIVGDDDQAIYEWRGSSPRFILKPKDYFQREFQTYTLNVNYRSPKNIVDYSQRLIACNQNREEKQIKPNSTDDAEVVVKKFHSHNDCLHLILELAQDANASGKPNQLGIIGRKKGQLIPMQIILTSEEIPFFARQDLNVLFSRAFKDLMDILDTVSNPHWRRTDYLVASFLKLLDYVTMYPLRGLYNIKSSLRHALSDGDVSTIEQCLQHVQAFRHSDLREDDKDHFYTAISKALPKGRNVSAVIESISEEFSGLQKHYPKSEDDIFYRDPPFLYLAEYASRYGTNFQEFIQHLEKAIRNMEKQIAGGSIDKDDDPIDRDIVNPVHLMTAFGAKGSEFETTVLLDVNDGVFPTKQAETADAQEAERRIFYVAVTRARKRMILLTVESILGRPVDPSPYIEEMGLSVPEECEKA